MFKGLTELLKYIRDERHWESEKKDAALNAIREALQATRTYVSNLNSGMPANRKQEEELSDLWSTAAVAARHIDRELAHRLDIKGCYWLEPDTWAVDDIYEAGIKLERVEAEFREMLDYLP